MNTARLLTRQLRYCIAAAESPADREEVQWWLDHVAALAALRSPLSAPVPAGPALPAPLPAPVPAEEVAS